MNKNFRVEFTVHENAGWTRARSELCYLTQIVNAFTSQQAQAMVEAQYGNRVQIHSVIQQ